MDGRVENYMQWFKKSIIRRTGVFVIIFIVIAFSIYAYISRDFMGNFFEEHSKKELLKDATQMATEIDMFIGKNIVLVEQMGTNQDFLTIAKDIKSRDTKRSHPLYERVVRQLQAIKAMDDDISLIYIGLTEGNDLITDIPEYDPKAGFNLVKRPWYIEMLNQEKTAVSNPYVDSKTGKLVISIAYPIFEDGKDIGALAIDLMLDDIYSRIKEYRVGEDGYTILLNRKGDVLYHPDKEIDIFTKMSDTDGYLSEFEEQMTSGESGIVEFGSGDDAKYVAYVPIEHSNWIVGTVIPKSEVLEPLRRFRNIDFLILTGIIAVMVFIINGLTNSISKPIMKISHEIEVFSNDDREMNFPDEFFERHDEIGILANGLRFMGKRLDYYIKEIESTNKELFNEIESRKDIQLRLEMILKLLSETEEGIFILKEDFCCMYNNNAFEKITDYPERKLKNLNLLEKKLLINEDIIETVKRGTEWSGEIAHKNLQDEALSLYLKISKVKYEDHDYYIGSIADLTKHKQNEKAMYELRYSDALTALNNKLFFEESVNEIIYRHEQNDVIHALIIVNVDNFRVINEAKGFDFGNKLLIAIADKLKEAIEQKDILARLGNDEFVIFKPNIRTYEVIYREVIELSREINKAHIVSGEEIFISASVGIGLYPGDADNYSKLLKTATSALNNVKNNKGGGLEFYNKEINSKSIYKYEMKNRLRNALTMNEFMLYYQPQIEIESKRVIAVEALLRWRSSPEMIPPNIFIPIAEESKLIIPIGEWVLLNACQFGYKLYTMGYDIQVAVNISRLQFKNPYINILINSILEETKLPPNLLELEITEGILMDNEEECEIILENFKNMGIKIAIDDFGTGYSSLSYLKKFSVDKIKIDRAFIKDIPKNDNGAIAKVIIELAGILNMGVIAEGVETEEQMDFLLENNCKEFQGFLFSKPLPEEKLLGLLKENLNKTQEL